MTGNPVVSDITQHLQNPVPYYVFFFRGQDLNVAEQTCFGEHSCASSELANLDDEFVCPVVFVYGILVRWFTFKTQGLT